MQTNKTNKLTTTTTTKKKHFLKQEKIIIGYINNINNFLK